MSLGKPSWDGSAEWFHRFEAVFALSLWLVSMSRQRLQIDSLGIRCAVGSHGDLSRRPGHGREVQSWNRDFAVCS